MTLLSPSVNVPKHSLTGTHATVLLVLLVVNHHPPSLPDMARDMLPDYKHDQVTFLHETLLNFLCSWDQVEIHEDGPECLGPAHRVPFHRQYPNSLLTVDPCHSSVLHRPTPSCALHTPRLVFLALKVTGQGLRTTTSGCLGQRLLGPLWPFSSHYSLCMPA